MGLGEGVIRVESADPEIVKGRQVEFPVVLERSNIVDLQFDIEYNSALLSLNKQSGAEHSLGAVVEPLNLTSRATISTQLGTGKAMIHIVSKEPLLNLGGPLSIAKLRFTILGVANQEMVVTPKNVIATDASGAQIPVTVSAGKVRVIAPAALTCEKEIFAPVCGLDEKTYDNACEAKRAGVVVRSSEPCKADLISTETYPSMVEMKLTTSGFSPFVIDIAAGGTIVFINNDVVSHIIVRNEDKTERIDPGEKTMMKLPNNRAIYTIESEQLPDFAATVVVH